MVPQRSTSPRVFPRAAALAACSVAAFTLAALVAAGAGVAVAADASAVPIADAPAATPAIASDGRTIARCGEGFLEDVDGHLVVHLAGTPYEMGFQHGRLLRDRVHAVVRHLLDVKAKDMTLEWAGVKFAGPQQIIQGIQL
ncbi:MAG: hypothetical protein FJ284_16135, partial [Planctomycetes bacterium]|nr:hypothetical protein [Planctomycetota bacterium]